jgi:hypothetical protein
LADLIDVRKQVMIILSNIGTDIKLAANPLHVCHSLFALLTSYVVDPVNTVGPVKASAQFLMPRPGSMQPDMFYRPPATADHALEALSRMMITDDNRAVMSSYSTTQLWTLFDGLCRMLPVSDQDFQLFRLQNHLEWLAYSERITLCLYSVAYLAPVSLKTRMRKDISYRKLFRGLIERQIRSANGQPIAAEWDKNPFSVQCRRLIETLGIIVDKQDNFTTTKMLPFGSKDDAGFGDRGDGDEAGVFPRDDLLHLLSHIKGVDEAVIVEVSRWASEGKSRR